MKLCIECKQLKPLEDFRTLSKSSDGKSYYCKECSRRRDSNFRVSHSTERKTYMKKYWKTHKRTESQKEIQKSVSKRIHESNKTNWMKILLEKNMVSCSICGYNDSFAAIDFHHVNPSEKEYSIGQLLIQKPTELRIAELEKVISVCANCHRRLHFDKNFNYLMEKVISG